MEISEIRIKLVEESDDRLRGFCSVTFRDGFVVRDLRIIQGESGLFVAMPSRKVTAHCPRCHTKNHLRAKFCNHCGARLPFLRPPLDQHGRPKLYADIAHPVTQSFRDRLQAKVIEEFFAELERAKQPGYRSRYDDAFEYEDYLPEASTGGIRRVDPPHLGPGSPGANPPGRESSQVERESERRGEG